MTDDLLPAFPRIPGPSGLARLGNDIIFIVGDSSMCSLWKSDGTEAGTEEISQFDMYSGGTSIAGFGDAAFFTTSMTLSYEGGGGDNYSTLWVTDGTADGTISLAHGSAPFYGSDVRQGIRQPGPGSLGFQVVGDSGLYYFVKSQTGLDGDYPRAELWSYKCGEKTAKILFEAKKENHIPFLALEDGKLYFALNNDIYMTEGESVTHLFTYQYDPWRALGASEAQAGNRTFFVKYAQGYGSELWIRDEEERMIKDIYPGSNSSDPAYFAVYNDLLFFSSDSGRQGRELWISDGTETGTVLVKDVFPGEMDSSPTNLTVTDEGVLFVSSYNHLWISDGTEAGTRMIAYSITDSFQRYDPLPNIGGKWFYSTNIREDNMGWELYTGGLHGHPISLVKDINKGTGSSNPRILLTSDNLLFFTADDGVHGIELWKSDGTETGTYVVKMWHNTEYETQEITDPDEIELDVIEEQYYNIP